MIKMFPTVNWNELPLKDSKYTLKVCSHTHVESRYKESQGQEIQVGIHEDPFNLISIFLCEPCKNRYRKPHCI